MRRINNSSPPFLQLLLCTASTGEEMRFFSPHFPQLILQPNSLDSRFWVSSLLQGFYTPTRCLSGSRQGPPGWLWSHVLVASNWTHTHTHTLKQKKNRKMTQPFVHAHLKPESAWSSWVIRSYQWASAKLQLRPPCLPSVLSFYTTSIHHALIFLPLFPPWSVELGRHSEGQVFPQLRQTRTCLTQYGHAPPLFGSFGWRLGIEQSSIHGNLNLKVNYTLKYNRFTRFFFKFDINETNENNSEILNKVLRYQHGPLEAFHADSSHICLKKERKNKQEVDWGKEES